MTAFVGASMEVGSLTLSLFIIRFEMLLLISLGRALGKYLKGGIFYVDSNSWPDSHFG